MSEPSPSTPESEPQPASAESTAGQSTTMAGIERTFLRLTFWQTLLSVAGVFTGAVALYAALNESQAVREQTAAAVWPYVQMIINDTDNGSEASFGLSLENVGVGPARMRGMQLTLSEKPVLTWDDAAERLLGEAARVGVDYGRSSVSRRVIAPGEAITAFQTHDRTLALAMQGAVYSGKAQLRYCFCSIFDQCWYRGATTEDAGGELEEVPLCPDFAEGAFQD